jgi:general secretion pathway protein L
VKRQIYIHLGDPTLSGNMPEQVYWFVKSGEDSIAPVFHGDLKTAANHALGCRVVIIVSGVEVVLTDVTLPNMNRQKLVKAIPYALEEQLANDVEDNHFAVGERQREDAINVAIVERKIMEMWLNGLKDVGIQPDVVTTEVLAVPYEEKCWTLVLKSGDKQSKAKAILRTNLQAGIALDIANVEPLMNSMLESISDENRPGRLHIITCDATSSDPDDSSASQSTSPGSASSQMKAVAEQLEKLAKKFSIEAVVEHADQSFLNYLSNQYNESRSINLLQGDYSRRERLEKQLRPWIPAAALAGVWLLLQFGLMLFDYQKLSSKDTELRARVTEIYRQAFPEDKNIVNPKVQMEQKLAELRVSANQTTDMLVLLAKAGDVLSDTNSLLIRTLRFKDETLDLDFEISDLQSLDQLKDRLTRETDLVVDIQSASSKKGKVESRMQLKVEPKQAADSGNRGGA